MVDIFYRKYCRWHNCYYENNEKINFNPSLKTTKNIIWIKGKHILFPMESMKPLGKFDYIDIDAIDNKSNMIIKPKRHNINTAPSRATRKVFATSTLFSMVRPYLRNIAYVGEKYKDCIASTGFYVCTPMPFINDQYLFILLISDYVVNSLNYYMKGDNSPSINRSDIEEFYFPIPSLNYQKKVVKKLNTIFPKLERIRENMSSLYSYVNNTKLKILEHYFGENSCYKSYYKKIPIKDVCLLERNRESESGALPYLEAKVIRGTKKPNIINRGIFIKNKTKIILVDGENSGEIMIAPCDGYMGSTFRIIKTDESKINSEYLSYFIYLHKKVLKDNKTGSATPHLNKKIFNQLEIILPPIDKQIEICYKLLCIFNILDRLS